MKGMGLKLKQAFISEMKRYISNHPMPKSVIYKNANEVIEHLESADGIIKVSHNESEAFKNWFTEMVETCIVNSQKH
ncbi:MAG: hypothetical protein DRN81_03940 [Thermoproteota archaeon]|nr:MAG: hypothetical protein DRN81_03940 [Candidatus Korarchaeota archaeon]